MDSLQVSEREDAAFGSALFHSGAEAFATARRPQGWCDVPANHFYFKQAAAVFEVFGDTSSAQQARKTLGLLMNEFQRHMLFLARGVHPRKEAAAPRGHASALACRAKA